MNHSFQGLSLQENCSIIYSTVYMWVQLAQLPPALSAGAVGPGETTSCTPVLNGDVQLYQRPVIKCYVMDTLLLNTLLNSITKLFCVAFQLESCQKKGISLSINYKVNAAFRISLWYLPCTVCVLTKQLSIITPVGIVWTICCARLNTLFE